MSPDGKAQTIKCRGCGQVGTIVVDSRDEFGGRPRRHGFHLHGEQNGQPVVACCKCQQIRPCEPGMNEK